MTGGLPGQGAAPDLLAQLRDVQPPAAPGWWPPAPGWWLLAALLLAAALAVLVLLLRRHRRRAPLRAAQRLLLAAWQQAAQQDQPPAAFAHQCNQLLKRTLRTRQLDHPALGLEGEAWRAWLAGLDAAWAGPAGDLLGDTRFQPPGRTTPAPADRAALHALTRATLGLLHQRALPPLATVAADV